LKILLNTTKTMDPGATAAGVRPTRPRFSAEAAELNAALRALDQDDLARQMDLGQELAGRTRADIALWGEPDRPAGPALFAFTGLVFQHLDAATLRPEAITHAQAHLRILSGLYGLLRPRDRIEAYRLEMGCKVAPPGARNLVAYWRPRLTAALDRELANDEVVLNLASQEYLRAVDVRALRGRVITPVFKEPGRGGKLRVVTVHAKQARGAMARRVCQQQLDDPAQLAGFGDAGWEPAAPPPERGEWLFLRT
jgi:hypothetical protein